MAATPDPMAKYQFIKIIGRGAFSVVWMAMDVETRDAVAVKVVDKSAMGEYSKTLKNEVEILKNLHHPNIISLIDIAETHDKIHLVTDLVTGGELFERIVQKGNYSEEDAIILVRKIVDAVKYLHDNNIVHRDLKPENLLLKSEDDDLDIRIADFGFSKIAGEDSLLYTSCGTPAYVAPEILEAVGYGKPVDMWSVGVITYILLCGYPPFFGEPVPVVFEAILHGQYEYHDEYWSNISTEAKQFIDSLLVLDPTQRLTAKQALEHPWLTGTKCSTIPINKSKMCGLVAERRRTKARLGNF
ncbi:protein serine/threonine kinase [Pelomyxa schiedti]|nr:protein serine/threonine kinase [Pelomyxa schiedti]